jgi:hypothetical protein
VGRLDDGRDEVKDPCSGALQRRRESLRIDVKSNAQKRFFAGLDDTETVGEVHRISGGGERSEEIGERCVGVQILTGRLIPAASVS